MSYTPILESGPSRRARTLTARSAWIALAVALLSTLALLLMPEAIHACADTACSLSNGPAEPHHVQPTSVNITPTGQPS